MAGSITGGSPIHVELVSRSTARERELASPKQNPWMIVPNTWGPKLVCGHGQSILVATISDWKPSTDWNSAPLDQVMAGGRGELPPIDIALTPGPDRTQQAAILLWTHAWQLQDTNWNIADGAFPPKMYAIRLQNSTFPVTEGKNHRVCVTGIRFNCPLAARHTRGSKNGSGSDQWVYTSAGKERISTGRKSTGMHVMTQRRGFRGVGRWRHSRLSWRRRAATPRAFC